MSYEYQKGSFVTVVCIALLVVMFYLGCNKDVDDVEAAYEALQNGNYEDAIGIYTKAIESGVLSKERPAPAAIVSLLRESK